MSLIYYVCLYLYQKCNCVFLLFLDLCILTMLVMGGMQYKKKKLQVDCETLAGKPLPSLLACQGRECSGHCMPVFIWFSHVRTLGR